MRRAGRLLQIIQLLQQRRITTAEQLAQELEVSIRTIYRDIQELNLSGIPIQGEAGVGYMLPKHFTLPPITFDHNELEALLLGIRMVKSWSDQELAQAARSALRKLSAVIPEDLRSSLVEGTLFAPDFMVPDTMKQYLPELRRVIKSKQKISIDYQKANGECSQRTLWPLALFYWGNSWSVSAWCELRNSFRNFRLDRIQSLKILEQKYPQESGKTLKDLKDYLEKEINKPAW